YQTSNSNIYAVTLHVAPPIYSSPHQPVAGSAARPAGDDRPAGPEVPVLPLACGVSRGFSRVRRGSSGGLQPGDRLAGRVHVCARQSAVGAGEAPREGGFRIPAYRSRWSGEQSSTQGADQRGGGERRRRARAARVPGG